MHTAWRMLVASVVGSLGWRRRTGAGSAIVCALASAACVASSPAARAVTVAAEARLVPLCTALDVRFRPDSAATYLQPGQSAEDAGRVVRFTAELPQLDTPHTITALVTVQPVPKGEREMFDRWDRAGNVRLVSEGRPDIELVRFMTSYGGRTEHSVDVTALAPLLHGRCTFRVFVDTWTSPGWKLDVVLRYQPVVQLDNATWALPVFYTDSFDRQSAPHGTEVWVDVPAGARRVVLEYIATGHCTDGIDADEFISKANVIAVDGVVVARFHPWRDDCRQFRDRNPFTSHWADGSWSSDYSRTGWCPGTEVLPHEFDLTDHLTPGRHRLRFVIEEMRPKDAQGQYGYWRVSARLVGWDHVPALWQND
jgi:hypothetical protein